MKIGEIRDFEGKKIICKEDIEDCKCCMFEDYWQCPDEEYLGGCSELDRKDGKGVIFTLFKKHDELDLLIQNYELEIKLIEEFLNGKNISEVDRANKGVELEVFVRVADDLKKLKDVE